MFDKAVLVQGVLLFLVVCIASAELGGALEGGSEKRAQGCDRGGEDADVELAGRPDGDVDAVPEEIVEFSVEGEVVDFDDARD